MIAILITSVYANSEGNVPREGELAVRRQNDIGDEVVVALQRLLGEAVNIGVLQELPDNQALVCKRACIRSQ